MLNREDLASYHHKRQIAPDTTGAHITAVPHSPLTSDAGREDSWWEGGWSEESFLTVLPPSVSMGCGWAACRDCILAVNAS